MTKIEIHAVNAARGAHLDDEDAAAVRTLEIQPVHIYLDRLFIRLRYRLTILWSMIAYAVRSYYENGDSTFFDLISRRFDAIGGVIHGLTHHTPSGSGCNCAPCRQRKIHY